jgi:2-isopropylmalate synthase
MSDKLIIFDTTLRDGEQSPGASMTKDEKIRIAKALEKMKVDVIEAGFAAASKGDFEAIKTIANTVKDSTVCSLARALDKDIDIAGKALKNANSGRIHTFIASSDIHMRMKLQMTPEQVITQAIHAVKRARKYSNDVEFSPEDAGRSDQDFLCKLIEAAISAGATTINIPDTVGYNIPHQFGATIKSLIERVPNSDKAIFSAHCHNDLGLAVANSLSAVLNGARQIECTINGLGERAGNTSLEEIVMAVHTRQDVFSCNTNIETSNILSISRLVSSITGFVVQPNKAIVGANAFAHEAGIHQDGVIKHRETYEIMRAEDVGWHANQLVLGKHSGRNALKVRLQKLGIEIDYETEFNKIFKKFKELADKKHEIFDEDLQILVSDVQIHSTNIIELVSLKTSSQTGKKNQANIVLSIDGKNNTTTAQGSGAVDATFIAINNLIEIEPVLQLYSVSNITKGADSIGEVSVRLEHNNNIVNGQGTDTDIIVASAKAYINALNKTLKNKNKVHPQI